MGLRVDHDEGKIGPGDDCQLAIAGDSHIAEWSV
jgi:hypothetical protein